MTRASKIHLPRMSGKDRHLTLCGRPADTMAVTKKADQATCSICQREYSKGNPKGAPQPSALTTEGTAPPAEDKYNDQQIALAQHPDIMKNVMKAMLECGYSKSYAKKHGYAVREKLYPLIREYQEQRARKHGISAARVQSELANIAFANMLDYIEVNEMTGEARPKGIHELTREQAAAIIEYETVPYTTEDGREVMILSRIKLIDKRAALIDLGKSIGMFNEKMQMVLRRENADQRVSLEEIPTEDLEMIEAVLLKAKGIVEDKRKDRRAITVQS